MNKELKEQRKISGFTLIEVMVSVSIFAIVVLVSMTAVLSIVDANKKAQSLDDVINNMNFTVESMVRDLRTGYAYNCGGVCNAGSAVNSITFTSSISSCQVTYSLSGTTIYKNECGRGNQALTSSNISVNQFNLYVLNPSGGTGQPLILMILRATGKVGKQSTEFDLQTLISQRRLNI
ncbi:MAG: type II secretion system protein [bacterium]